MAKNFIKPRVIIGFLIALKELIANQSKELIE